MINDSDGVKLPLKAEDVNTGVDELGEIMSELFCGQVRLFTIQTWFSSIHPGPGQFAGGN